MQKVPSGTCEMCWGLLSTKWVQVSATCIVQSGWQRALHCGVGYLSFFGVFPLNRNISAVTCCRPGTEHALPVGGCMEWVLKSNASSSRKCVSTWLCSHGVFKQEIVFIHDLVSLFKLLQHFTLYTWDVSVPLWFYSFLRAGLWPGPSWGFWRQYQCCDLCIYILKTVSTWKSKTKVEKQGQMKKSLKCQYFLQITYEAVIWQQNSSCEFELKG